MVARKLTVPVPLWTVLSRECELPPRATSLDRRDSITKVCSVRESSPSARWGGRARYGEGPHNSDPGADKHTTRCVGLTRRFDVDQSSEARLDRRGKAYSRLSGRFRASSADLTWLIDLGRCYFWRRNSVWRSPWIRIAPQLRANSTFASSSAAFAWAQSAL